jgi:hypothetical protein
MKRYRCSGFRPHSSNLWPDDRHIPDRAEQGGRSSLLLHSTAALLLKAVIVREEQTEANETASRGRFRRPGVHRQRQYRLCPTSLPRRRTVKRPNFLDDSTGVMPAPLAIALCRPRLFSSRRAAFSASNFCFERIRCISDDMNYSSNSLSSGASVGLSNSMR